MKDAVAETLCVIPSLVRVLLDSAATAAAAAGPGSGELTTGLGSAPLTRALLVEAPGEVLRSPLRWRRMPRTLTRRRANSRSRRSHRSAGGAGGPAPRVRDSCTHAELPVRVDARVRAREGRVLGERAGPGCPGRYRPGADPVGGFGRVPREGSSGARRRRVCRRRGRASPCSLSRCYSLQSSPATRTRPRALWTPSGRASATLVKRAGRTHGFWRRQPGRSARCGAAGVCLLAPRTHSEPNPISSLAWRHASPRRATVTTTTTTRAPRTGLPWRRTCLRFWRQRLRRQRTARRRRRGVSSQRVSQNGALMTRVAARARYCDGSGGGRRLVARPTSSSPRDCTRTRWCSWPGRTRSVRQSPRRRLFHRGPASAEFRRHRRSQTPRWRKTQRRRLMRYFHTWRRQVFSAAAPLAQRFSRLSRRQRRQRQRARQNAHRLTRWAGCSSRRES